MQFHYPITLIGLNMSQPSFCFLHHFSTVQRHPRIPKIPHHSGAFPEIVPLSGHLALPQRRAGPFGSAAAPPSGWASESGLGKSKGSVALQSSHGSWAHGPWGQGAMGIHMGVFGIPCAMCNYNCVHKSEAHSLQQPLFGELTLLTQVNVGSYNDLSYLGSIMS